MSICENCISLDTCAVAIPNTEKCFFFVPTEEYRIVNSKEYAIGYEQGRADKEKELQGIKDLGALYSEIRADERSRVIGIIATRLEKRFSGALREDEVKLLMYEIHRILEEVNSMK